jgi:predicted GNAT superfamily acetyltransferase
MLVHWDLNSALAVEACAGRGQAASFAAERDRGAVVALSADDDGAPLPGLPLDRLPLNGLPLNGGSGARALLIGVPADIEAMRLSAPALAGAWRTALRDVLSPLLSGGARVTGFDRIGGYVVSLGGDVR